MPLRSVKACVAGSSALSKVLESFCSTTHQKWTAGDADILFLEQELNNRLPVGNVDIVQCKEKTVEDLLLNFDLPICRVAFNFSYMDFDTMYQCNLYSQTKCS